MSAELGNHNLITHHPYTAAAQWQGLAGLYSVGMSDTASTLPAHTSVAKTSQSAPLNPFVMKGDE